MNIKNTNNDFKTFTKSDLRIFVNENWNSLPSYSTLKFPVIEEIQKATVGACAGLVFYEDNKVKIVLLEAGLHYKRGPNLFMMPGGFINLTNKTGSHFVKVSDSPENPQDGVCREIEEEIIYANGKPVLTMKPERLNLLDTKTLLFETGEVRLVIGFYTKLIKKEILKIKEYVETLKQDKDLQKQIQDKTINIESNLPEIASIRIFNLDDVVNSKVNLLHNDQVSLFYKISQIKNLF